MKSLKISRLFWFLVLGSLQVTAQPLLQTIGLGNFRENGTAVEAGLGYATTAHYDSLNFLPNNPAGWHDLRTVRFLVGGDIGFQMVPSSEIYQPTGSTITSQFERLSRFQIGLPLGSRIYASLGTEPLTDMAGSFKATTGTDSLSTTLAVKNSGGVWSMFVGAGYRVNEKWSLGLKWQHLTGYYSQETVQWYPEFQTNSEALLAGYIRGDVLELGLQTRLSDNLVYGVTTNFPVNNPVYDGKMTSSGTNQSLNFTENLPDWPIRLAMGLEYKYSERVFYLLDLSQRFFDESTFSNNNLFGIPDGWSVNSSSSVNMGLLIKHRDLMGSVLDKTDWRVGFYNKIFYASPSENTYIRETYLTGGFGMPLPQSRSRLDLAVGFGKRGGFTGYPVENIVNIKVSIQTSEFWFTNAKRR